MRRSHAHGGKIEQEGHLSINALIDEFAVDRRLIDDFGRLRGCQNRVPNRPKPEVAGIVLGQLLENKNIAGEWVKLAMSHLQHYSAVP